MTRLFFTILMFGFTVSHAQTVNWSNPVAVADDSLGNIRPHVAMCNGVPVVVWGKQQTNKIYASRFVDGTFATPVEVAPNVPAFEQGWMAHEIAAAGDTLFVVFGDISMSHVYIVRSLDGGLTFGDTARVDDGSNGFMPVTPSVDVMAGGNPVVSFIVSELDFSDARTLVSHSNDGGLTFSSPVDATESTPGEACDCCKAQVIASGNRSILVFRNNENNLREFYAAISDDGGQTFPTSVQIDHTNWNVNICPTSPASAKLLGDTLTTVFMSGAGNGSKIYVSSVDLSNLSQPAVQYIVDAPDAGTQNYPRLAGATHQLGTVWQQSQVGVHDVRFSTSFSGTMGFGESIELAEGLTGNNTMPDIAYGNNQFAAVFENSGTQQVYFMLGEIEVATFVENISNEPLVNVSQQSNNETKLMFNKRCDDATVKLISINGQELLLFNTNQVNKGESFHFDTSAMSSGMYLISVVSHQGVSTEKIVVSRD